MSFHVNVLTVYPKKKKNVNVLTCEWRRKNNSLFVFSSLITHHGVSFNKNYVKCSQIQFSNTNEGAPSHSSNARNTNFSTNLYHDSSHGKLWLVRVC